MLLYQHSNHQVMLTVAAGSCVSSISCAVSSLDWELRVVLQNNMCLG